MKIQNKLISETVLQLYRGSREWPFDVFQARALSLLQHVVAFDSALWGTAKATGAIQTAYLNNQPPDMLNVYSNLESQDVLHRQAIANPGVTMNLRDLVSRQDFERTSFYRGFARHHKMEAALSTAILQKTMPLLDFVSLWRRNPRRQFTAHERLSIEFLMPHLIESHHVNRLNPISRSGSWSTGRRFGAVCDRRGALHQADDRFISLLRSEWPDWRTTEMPDEVCAAFCEGAGKFSGKKIYIESFPLGNLILLRGRKKASVDRLGHRERLVAESYASGHTYSEIAGSLKVSPATVRSQIESVYKKLAVANKVQLVSVLASV